MEMPLFFPLSWNGQVTKTMKEDSNTEDNVLKKTFGILKHLKKPTAKLLKEVDEELWHD